MRKTILYIIAVVFILAAAVATYFIWNRVEEKPQQLNKVVKTVFVENVQNGSVPIIIPANGNLVAKNRLELYAEVQGVFRNSAHAFKPGQQYNRGETLLNLDASEYYASVQSAKSELYNLVTSIMPDLRLDYPEIYPKWQSYLNNFDINKGTPALPDASTEKEKYFITGRGIYSSYYNIKNLEQRLGKYRITAPFSGVLTEALVTRGTLVRSGQKLGEFIDTSVFELEVAISKSFSDLLKVGEKVMLSDLDGIRNYQGVVSRVNARVNQSTQTIQVFIEVKGYDDLKEGMYLEAQLEAKNEENAIRIPRKLLVDNSKVYIVKDSILDLIDVNTVYFSDKDVVVKGVPDGTQLLSRSVPGSFAGMPVKVYEEKSQSQSQPKS